MYLRYDSSTSPSFSIDSTVDLGVVAHLSAFSSSVAQFKDFSQKLGAIVGEFGKARQVFHSALTALIDVSPRVHLRGFALCSASLSGWCTRGS